MTKQTTFQKIKDNFTIFDWAVCAYLSALAILSIAFIDWTALLILGIIASILITGGLVAYLSIKIQDILDS